MSWTMNYFTCIDFYPHIILPLQQTLVLNDYQECTHYVCIMWAPPMIVPHVSNKPSNTQHHTKQGRKTISIRTVLYILKGSAWLIGVIYYTYVGKKKIIAEAFMSKLSHEQYWNTDLVFPLRVDCTVRAFKKCPSQSHATSNTHVQFVKFSNYRMLLLKCCCSISLSCNDDAVLQYEQERS